MFMSLAERLMSETDPETGSPVEGDGREAIILEEAQIHNNYPEWLTGKSWHELNVSLRIDKRDRHLTMFAMPDVLTIGGLRVAAKPQTFQAIAHTLNAILPSKRLSDFCWSAANQRLAPIGINESSPTATSSMVAHHNAIEKQLASLPERDEDELLAGHKVDVVVGPGLDGGYVARYGMHSLTGKPSQMYPGPYRSEDVRADQGARFFSRACLLDGRPVDLATVFTHPDLHTLVSDQGPFAPFFPNAGVNAKNIGQMLRVGKQPLDIASERKSRSWGTLEWLGAISASIGITTWAYHRFRGKPV